MWGNLIRIGRIALSRFDAITFFTAILAIVSILQWNALKSTDAATHTAADAAKKAAEVAERALVAVERPIFLVDMPTPSDTKQPVNSMKSKLAVRIENVGKQVGVIHAITAGFWAQKESAPPPLSVMQPTDGSGCLIAFVGELVIKATDTRDFWCERQTPLTPDEINGINERSLFGFFRIALYYDDTVGTPRASVFIFVMRPPFDSGIFVQALDSDQVVDAGTVREQKQKQRELVGGLLKDEATIIHQRSVQPSK